MIQPIHSMSSFRFHNLSKATCSIGWEVPGLDGLYIFALVFSALNLTGLHYDWPFWFKQVLSHAAVFKRCFHKFLKASFQQSLINRYHALSDVADAIKWSFPLSHRFSKDGNPLCLLSPNLLMYTFTSNSKAVLFWKKTSQIHITSFAVQISVWHDMQ